MMEFESNIIVKNVDLGLYYNLLKEEDYDFKNKNISIDIKKNKYLEVNLKASSLLEYKIGTYALINSLTIIEKTLYILENE